MRSLLFSALLFVVSGATAFSLDDVHYWVGEGSSKCAVVIDWGDRGGARAWGYKWRGTCTNLAEVVRRIVHEDPRLVADDALTFFGYDVNDCHPAWNKAAGTCTDPAALAAAGDWTFPGATVPQNGDVFTVRLGTGPASTPVPAESPYGFEVVDSYTLESDLRYNAEANVLGHPTMGIFSADAQYNDTGSVINPAYPAFGGGLLMSLIGDEDWEEPGFVTIKFDHDVIDDPKNPWGVDFIVFGNSFAVKEGTSYVTLGGDPAQVRLTGQGAAEGALVEVSQDGETWYAFEDGPYADDAMPTLGYLYDPAHPDTGLFGGNAYWGLPAHATRPVNPKCTFGDFEGLTLAQACQAYDGSAGGTGYDLSRLWDLPENADGRKWFRYVRISCLYSEEPNEDGDYGYTMPEIDAVADVAPVSDYELWAEQNYTRWTTFTQDAAADARAENGLANALCFAWDISPWTDVDADFEFKLQSITSGPDVLTLVFRSPRRMEGMGGIAVRATASLDAGWTDVAPTFVSSAWTDGAWENTFTVPAAAGAFFKLAVLTE